MPQQRQRGQGHHGRDHGEENESENGFDLSSGNESENDEGNENENDCGHVHDPIQISKD